VSHLRYSLLSAMDAAVFAGQTLTFHPDGSPVENLRTTAKVVVPGVQTFDCTGLTPCAILSDPMQKQESARR
jgi:hypothetical protein